MSLPNWYLIMGKLPISQFSQTKGYKVTRFYTAEDALDFKDKMAEADKKCNFEPRNWLVLKRVEEGYGDEPA